MDQVSDNEFVVNSEGEWGILPGYLGQERLVGGPSAGDEIAQLYNTQKAPSGQG